MTKSQEIAQTILAQLGGGRFLAMTGAKDLLATGNGLAMRIPARLAKDRIALIRIDLDPSDTYTIKAMRMAKGVLEVVAEESGIYCDQLQDCFTLMTGLDTHL